MKNNVFSARLKEERKRKNLTMLDLAERAGITKGAISLYEKGEREPLISTVIKLAKVLGVPIAYLSGQEVTEEEKKSYLDQVCGKYGLDSMFIDMVDLNDEELKRLEEDIELSLRIIKQKYKL